jgi:hypothetical protein
MTTVRSLLLAVAAIVLFAIGFGAARALGTAAEAPPAVVTLTPVAAHAVTVRAPGLRGTLAALAARPAAAVQDVSTGAAATAPASSGVSAPPSGTASPSSSSSGTKTFSYGEN